MASIRFHHVDFSYPQSVNAVFEGLSLSIDSAWRTGVVGRNGLGKTTLLKLACGDLRPAAGHVEAPLPTRYFGGAPEGAGARSTLTVLRNRIAPYDRWEADMERLLALGSEEAIDRYGDLEERYRAMGGYLVNAAIAREFAAMGLAEDLLERRFGDLSGGEQTRALIVALFVEQQTLEQGFFPLIDEPTNHLDAAGRLNLMDYLSHKPGFLLVSHDRRFLDGAVDHVLSLNRSDVRVNVGNYSSWRLQMDRELETERRTRVRIERDVQRLTAAARDTRSHATSRESDKYGTGAMDKGFIGHRAARQMRRARNVERRIEAELEAKRGLLANQEKQRRLAVTTRPRGEARLLVAQNLTLTGGGRTLCRELSLAVSPGERIAVTGPNGCGKTTLLDTLCGYRPPAAGTVQRPGHVRLARGFQQPLWQRGRLPDHLRAAGIDETRFRQLLGVLGVAADTFEQDLATLSHGQRRKVDLTRTLLAGADLLIWDEPLNFIDLPAREQIEAAVLRDAPTLVFVEHDAEFVERVASRVLHLTESQAPASL